MLKDIYIKAPDVLCFSCYIWNIEIVKELIKTVKKILPNVKIVLGGPEVSYTPIEFLNEYADIVVLGEGEKVFNKLCKHFIFGAPDLTKIEGIAYCESSPDSKTKKNFINNLCALPDLNTLVFPYTDIDLHDLSNKILYYESSRGCPYSCAYCLSSVAENVRFWDVEITKTHIDFFLANSIKLVKFVDRTFNCNPNRAIEIWKHIIKSDNGHTCFHFEIGADLLSQGQIDCLKDARKGLIQFEAGVQSTNQKTLKEICRVTDLKKLSENIVKIKDLDNIHIHLDLIAGLPYEDFNSFKKSFNDCFKLQPDMLQLGFLKLIKGSALWKKADDYGIAYKDSAPYEVVFTKHISYGELLMLKDIENLLDLYYNGGLFSTSLNYFLEKFNEPFDFFYNFSLFWNENGYYKESHNKHKRYEILFRYASGLDSVDLDFFKNLLKFDMFMSENIKNLPTCLTGTDYAPIKGSINAFFANEDNARLYFPKFLGRSLKELRRICHIEEFSYNVPYFIRSKCRETAKNYCLFVYDETRPKVYTIDLSERRGLG